MKKIMIPNNRQSREYIANPFCNETLESRIRKSGYSNYDSKKSYIKELTNGYGKMIYKKKSRRNNYIST